VNYSPTPAQLLGQTDIYLIDQLLKGRYQMNDIILDAGCGYGRNLHWFLGNNSIIYGVDQDGNAIDDLKDKHPSLAEERFRCASLTALPFEDEFFHHVICSAVLHFAKNTLQFQQMVTQLVRVLKPGGSLFIRMTSDIGIEDRVHPLGEGVYAIPDGSRRFLLTRSLLADTMEKNRLSFLEPLKTVNVNDIRCMSTLVLTRSGIPRLAP
jgi:tellurite methyltransferase